MMNKTVLVSFIALLLLAFANAAEFTFCVGGIPPPTINESNTVDVYYMEVFKFIHFFGLYNKFPKKAPVFEGEFGSLFAIINAYHSAFAFVDRFQILCRS